MRQLYELGKRMLMEEGTSGADVGRRHLGAGVDAGIRYSKAAAIALDNAAYHAECAIDRATRESVEGGREYMRREFRTWEGLKGNAIGAAKIVFLTAAFYASLC